MSVIPHIDTIEKIRKRTFLIVLTLYMLGVIFLISMVIYLTLYGLGIFEGKLYAYILHLHFIYAIAAFFIIGGVKQSSFQKKYRSEFTNDIVLSLFTNCTYNYKGRMPLEMIMEAGFYRRPDKYSGSNYFQGSLGSINFKCAEFVLSRRHKNKQGTYYAPYASGTFLVFDLDTSMPGRIKIVEKGFLDRLFPGAHKIELESLEFNKKFETNTDHDLLTFYLLTPQIQEKILELEKSIECRLYLCLSDNRLYISLGSFSIKAHVSLFKKINDNFVNACIDKLSIPRLVIECLDLDGDKYKTIPNFGKTKNKKQSVK